MHDMRITLDKHLFRYCDRTNFGDSPRVITTQIDQHQVFGKLLGVGQQLLLQDKILGLGGPAFAGSCQWSNRNFTIIYPGQNFRRGADHVVIAKIEIHHVRRRIEKTQGPVNVHRVTTEIHRHSLCQHYLHHITGDDVILDFFHRLLVLLLLEMKLKITLGDTIAASRNFGQWYRLM